MPILGCEPSCLLTLVDEYRDFRLGPDADVVAAAAQLVDAFVADRDARARPAARAARRAGSCSTATASRRRSSGTAGTRRRPAADPGPGGQGARLGLLRHGRLVRLRAGPLRGERGPGQPRAPPGRGRRPRRPPGRPRLLLPQPGPRPGRHRRRASDPDPGGTA